MNHRTLPPCTASFAISACYIRALNCCRATEVIPGVTGQERFELIRQQGRGRNDWPSMARIAFAPVYAPPTLTTASDAQVLTPARRIGTGQQALPAAIRPWK